MTSGKLCDDMMMLMMMMMMVKMMMRVYVWCKFLCRSDQIFVLQFLNKLSQTGFART